MRVFLKGAPEIVIEYCTKYYDRDGNQLELTSEVKNQIITDIIT